MLLIVGASWTLRAADVPVELTRLRELYEAQIQKIDEDYLKERLDKPMHYLEDLAALGSSYQKSGNLRSLLKVRQERDRFDKARDLDSMVPVAAPADLRALQAKHIAAFRKTGEYRAARKAELKKKYAARLVALQTDLTKQNRIDEALVVMEAAEVLKGTSGSSSPTSPAPGVSPPQAVSSDPLSAIHGDVVRWNPLTSEITVAYDFSAPEQLEDWAGGEGSEDEQLIARERLVRFKPAFAGVYSIDYETSRLEGDGPLAVALSGNLHAELGSGEDGVRNLLYQDHSRFPILDERGDVRDARIYFCAIKLDGGKVKWDVNRLVQGHRPLLRPLRYPTWLGVGSAQCTSTFDNITVTGVLRRSAR